MPLCQVKLHVGNAPGPFGVFGEYDRLTLTFDNPPRGKHILARDLPGDEPIDITAIVKFDEASVYLSGDVLRQAETRHRTPGDVSSRGRRGTRLRR